MAFEYQVKKTQRISMVSFQRAVTGLPQLHYPDIDDRGYFREFDYSDGWPHMPKEHLSGFDRGPVVGITAGNTSTVKLKRERISNSAPLFATSSNEIVMRVSPKGELPRSETLNLEITGEVGAGVTPLAAKVEIRYGSKTGVIIAELTVFVFTKFEVLLIPHLTKIRDDVYDHTYPEVTRYQAVIDAALAIWEPCGISLMVYPLFLKSERTLKRRGEVNTSLESDVESLFGGDDHTDKAINVYFVPEILENRKGDPRHQIAGFCTNPAMAKSKKINSGIAVSLNAGVITTMGHEIGHFLGLSHTDFTESDNPREDLWSKRMIMYPSPNLVTGENYVTDVGYGKKVRGAALTMKNLFDSKFVAKDVMDFPKNHITDPEWETVRTSCYKKDGPYK